MIDRTSAPTFVIPRQFKLKRAETFFLNNGVPVHTIDIGALPVLKIEFIYKAGTWFEQQRGIAFFTNKMLPEGSKSNSSAEISSLLDQHGAYLEMYPGPDYSGVAIYILERHLGKLLPLVHELLTSPGFSKDELQILQDLQIQYLNVNKEKSGFLATRVFKAQLFGSDHPYGKSLETTDIQAQNPDELKAFHSEYYHNNFEIIVSGKVSTNTIDLIGNIFDQGAPYVNRDFTPKKGNGNINRVYVPKDDKLQSSIRYGKEIITKQHPDYIKLLLLNEILGGYFGSRLMQNIREQKGYTYGIHSSLVNVKNGAYWIVGTDVKKEHSLDTIEEIELEIKKLQTTLVPEHELTTVKNYFKGAYLSSITTPFSIAEKFKNTYFYNLDYDFYDKLFDRMDEVSREDLIQIARTYLNTDMMLEVIIG